MESFLCGFFFLSFFLKVAVKSIRKEKIKDEQDLIHIRREIEIMSSLCHPHIITIYEGTLFQNPTLFCLRFNSVDSRSEATESLSRTLKKT